MKLLIVSREFPPHVLGGLSYHLGYLYGELAERGHEVTVLTGACRTARRTAKPLVHEDIAVQTVPYWTFYGQHLTVPRKLRRVLEHMDVEAFDAAVTHTPLPIDLPIPTVGKYHDCFQAERPYYRQELGGAARIADTLVNPTRRAVDRRSLATVDYAVFNSERNREAWQRQYGSLPPNRTIYNGVDTDVFSPHNGDQGEYVLFVGDQVRKGRETVLAFAERSDRPVYVVGAVSDPNVRSFDRVSQERLAELYAGAVATIHPAEFEAFGNVVLESLACGTPVVTTSDCGASELLDESVGAVDRPLAAGVEHCSSLARRDCIERAREHTWERVAEETESLLRHLTEAIDE